MERLGDLSEVDLFRDDAQIERIDFEFREAPTAGCTIELDLVASGGHSTTRMPQKV